MRKLVCILLCICLAFGISACSRPAQNETPASTAATTLPADTTGTAAGAPTEDIPVAQEPMVSVSMPIQSETFSAEDGTDILTYNYQYMVLPFSDTEVAESITLEFLNRVDETTADKDALLAAAKDAYGKSSANWTPYQYTVEYTPKRIDSGVLSLLGCDARFTGAHMEKIYRSVNYSMVTGRTLSLYNILNDKSDSDKVCALAIEVLSQQASELYLFDDYEATVKHHFSAGINDAWYFSPDGLCFFFSPYDIAPYSSGVVVAEIPYEKLAGILKDAYFPAERATAAGDIFLLPFTTENHDKFTKFSELTLHTGADKFLLYTDKAAYDITIENGTFSDGGVFQKEYAVFALSSLTPGDAITVEANLSGNACLHLQYRSGDRAVHKYITADAEGNIQFIGGKQ